MATAPPDTSPDYVNANKSPYIIGIICTVTGVSTLFVGARIFVRGYIMKKLQMDDYVIIFSEIMAWLCVAFSIVAVEWGNGRHFSTLSVPQEENVILYTILGFPPGIMSFALPKFAVVALLTRLMNPSKMHRIFLWILVTVCFFGLSGCIVILFAQCTPARSQWDFSITEKKCWNPWLLVHYSMVAGTFSAVTDLYLAIYPALVLFKLQLSIKKKVALSCALGIGSVATIVAIYKTTRLPSLASADFSWDTSDLVIWTIIEGSTIIIASCIPILQPLVDMISGRRTLKVSGYKSYGSSRDQKTADLELQSGRHRRGGSRHDDLDTVVDKYDGSSSFGHETSKLDSQESILGPDHAITTNGNNGASAPREPKQVSKQPRALSGASGSHIIRTHEVTVEYEKDGVAIPETPAKWRGY